MGWVFQYAEAIFNVLCGHAEAHTTHSVGLYDWANVTTQINRRLNNSRSDIVSFNNTE